MKPDAVKEKFFEWVYSEGLPVNKANSAWGFVRDVVWEHFDFSSGFSGTSESICDCLKDRFSPGKIGKVVEYALMLQAAEHTEWVIKEAVLTEAERLDRDAACEYSAEDDDWGHFNVYAVLRSDWIEVIANVPGMGKRLPELRRKYIGGKGDMRWSYPLDSQAAVKAAVDFMINESGEKV